MGLPLYIATEGRPAVQLSTWLWIAMLLYGLAMWRIAPRVKDAAQFFGGRSGEGRDIGTGMLVATVVISWIFAKSITNAANLGESYGLVGAVAYAGWYLSIPVAGLVIFRLRTVHGFDSLAGFLRSRYGQGATLAFLLVVLVRLMNEVWSNTAVVGAYFGASGSTPYFAGALAFTAITLLYSLRGGLRSSILTDLLQFGLFAFLLAFVLAVIVPARGAAPLLSSGEWTLAGGVDLLLVALLQSLSYPFHDPVLTDRAFITRPGAMLKGYLFAGLVAGVCIVLFGLTGVYAQVAGIPAGQDSPIRVAQAFGVATLVLMTILMMVSAGSTLDSTLSSVAKALVLDGRRGGTGGDAPAWLGGGDLVAAGRRAMVLAVLLGTIPLFSGAAIIKATTVSGTMVLGLAPPFLLFGLRRAGRCAFHLGFWPGVAIGVLHVVDRIPAGWAMGDGPYAALLGANVIGTGLVFGGFLVGSLCDVLLARGVRPATAALVGLGLALPVAGSAGATGAPRIAFGGQTMLRYTTRFADLDRPSAEVYNVRLVSQATRGELGFLAELRFRQTKLRSYSPSNVWLQQAHGRWQAGEGVDLSAGLIYNQLGLFWDGSWFGNLPYLNGHKLDPDLNLQLHVDRPLGKRAGLELWLQASPGEDGLNGTFATANKEARLWLPADPEVDPAYREALALRARALPRVELGEQVELALGASLQRSVYDRTLPAGAGTRTGRQLVVGAEATLRLFDRVELSAEQLAEELRGLADAGEVERDYQLLAAQVELPAGRLQRLVAGTSFQRTDYPTEGFDEWFTTARLFGRVNDLLGVTAEYVRWQLGDEDEPELDRLELILHFYY